MLDPQGIYLLPWALRLHIYLHRLYSGHLLRILSLNHNRQAAKLHAKADCSYQIGLLPGVWPSSPRYERIILRPLSSIAWHVS